MKSFLSLLLSATAAILTLTSSGFGGVTPVQIASLQTRSPQPTAAGLEGVAGHGSILVAVGSRGGAVKSLDGGKTWSTMPDLVVGNLPQDMYGVATDGTRFVAVGLQAAVTTDLKAWEWSSTSLGGFRIDVTYGQGKFVAAGRGANVAVSSDGLEWTLADLPPDTSLESITYGDGVFIGAGSNARIVRSTDAITWEVVKPSNDAEGRFRGVRYANGLFIAAGDKGLVYTSPDGLTWTKPPHESTTNMSRAYYFNGRYIILDSLSSTQLTSDFLTFERNPLGFSGYATELVIAGDLLVAVGSAGLLATSTDGVHWIERRESLGDHFDSVVFAANHFVVSDVGTGRLFSSDNGAVWTQRYETEFGFRTKVAYGGGQFCVITGAQECLRSVDGRSWQTHPLGMNIVSEGLRYANGRFLLVGRSGEIASSPDGITWTDHPTGSDAYLQDVNFFNGTYVAVGLEDSLLTSPDLLNWTARTSGIETTDRKNFSRLEVTKDQFVLFQGLGVPSVSRDGVNWTLIEGSNVRFFATATGVDDLLGVYSLASGQVIHNPPGNDPGDWERLVLPVAANFTALASGNGIVVGVGQNGLLMSSPLESGGYDGWATGQFGATGEASVKEATADPDGDGQSNLEEYVRQTNPNVGTPSLPLEQRQTSFGPEITWRQSVAAHDVQTTVEHSHDLQEWSSEGVSLSEKDPIGDDQTFTARVTGESGTTGELYLRVRWNLVR